MKFKKCAKIIVALSLLFYPSIVYAASSVDGLDLNFALLMEVFVSIHMSVFVLLPLSKIFSLENSKKVFWTLFVIRIVILLFCDFFVSTFVAVIDFISVFVGAFIIVPIAWVISGKISRKKAMEFASLAEESKPSLELKCSKCGTVLSITDNYCINCGQMVDSKIDSSDNTVSHRVLKPSDFDSMYDLSDDGTLLEFIKRQMVKLGVEEPNKLVPVNVLKRKRIYNIIFSLLLCFYISLVFFHFPVVTYVAGGIVLFIFIKLTSKYNFMRYIMKQIKARPSEKISNIIMLEKESLTKDNTSIMFFVSLVVAIVIPLVIFAKPKIFYEKTDEGYGVRFYAFGLTNFKTAEIPMYHKNEKVVSLRGNTFSNMPFLESVILPDTIKEIRGQAFKNCRSLVSVNIPNELEYLGGGAFFNATKLKEIELPDTLTFLGGEAFYGATTLEYIKLSNNLTEIRGETFEYCESLKSIVIPDKVKRIGGHAFYGDTNLSEVIISDKSSLEEIGSSAFRRCDSLYNISIPSRTYVNERAFKESPTKITKVYSRY